jgi:hypothetical protein
VNGFGFYHFGCKACGEEVTSFACSALQISAGFAKAKGVISDVLSIEMTPFRHQNPAMVKGWSGRKDVTSTCLG